MINKMHIDFYFRHLILKLIKSKYTSWAFSSEFKVKFAMNQIKNIALIVKRKIDRGDKT